MARTWLEPGEEIVVHVRPHWTFLGRPMVATALILVAAIVSLSGRWSGTLNAVLAVFLVLALVWLVSRYARWATTVMILTTERLLQRRGVFSRRVRQLPVAQIGEIDCRRRLRDRLFGSGDVVVTSVSQGQEVFEHLPRPMAIVGQMQRQADQARRHDGLDVSVPERLARLEELRRRGAISRADYASERARLERAW